MLADIVKLKFLIGEKSVISWKMILTVILLLTLQVIASFFTDYKVYNIAILEDEISELEYEFSRERFKLQTLKLESRILKEVTDIKQSEEPPKEIIVKIKK